MYKLALLLLSCFFITIVISKTSTNNVSEITKKNASRIIWVLNLKDGLEIDKLKSANEAEKMVFKSLIAPTIRRYKEENKACNESIANETVVSSTDPKNENDSIKKIKGDIMKILNKFIITYSTDIMNPKLTLYFLGPYTSLVVNFGDENLHYFINPPSPLPRWFYDTHKNFEQKGRSFYVDIPKEIHYEFYKQFYDLLQLFISYPV
ncbi:unnamed protein product [Colias eurytheme]|nr:unnamed protein product [Colias eurytheme]